MPSWSGCLVPLNVGNVIRLASKPRDPGGFLARASTSPSMRSRNFSLSYRREINDGVIKYPARLKRGHREDHDEHSTLPLVLAASLRFQRLGCKTAATRIPDDLFGQWRSAHRDGPGVGRGRDVSLQQGSSGKPYQQCGPWPADSDVALLRTLALRGWRQAAESRLGGLGLEPDSDGRLLRESFQSQRAPE